jgi:coenzyme F420-reducing hydrogenase alpha subunit
MSLHIEGRLQIGLFTVSDRVVRVDISSTRPLRLARVLHGKSTREALQTVPLLYRLCGTAQAHAAVLACEQALGLRAGRATARAREMLVWLETARDHLWRILLDWPGFLDEAVDKTAVAGSSGLLPELRQALFGGRDPFQPGVEPVVDDKAMVRLLVRIERLLERQVFDRPLRQWLAMRDVAGLAQWSGRGRTVAARLLDRLPQDDREDAGSSDVDFLPALDAARLHRCLTGHDAVQFIARPTWAGRCCETTPLARQRAHPLVRSLLREHGGGLLTRMAARLVELAAIPSRLRRLAATLADSRSELPAVEPSAGGGVGLGEVEAARGRLVHRVDVADDRVNAYQILAPTEWNFHPQGVVAKGLVSLRSGDESELRRKAALWINAVDPCVGYELRVH